MGKDIRINEDEFFIFIKMVKEYILNDGLEEDKKSILSFINYHAELRRLMNEKDLWFGFFKKNNSQEALDKYKELKEKFNILKAKNMWRFDE